MSSHEPLSGPSRQHDATPDNRRVAEIDAGNAQCLEQVALFRAEHAAGRATYADFSQLKQQHPYLGVLPCRAAGLDFVLLHAHDDVVGWEYLWFGADGYERDLTRTWVDWCRDASVVYDIGAYTGLMSVLAARANPASEVHLFEPMERTVARAQVNLRLNGVHQRVKLHTRAASDSPGWVQINLYRDENFLGTGNSLYEKDREVMGTKRIRKAVVDRYLRGKRPDVVKIDVEGHELATLRGMEKTIARSRPKMIVEMWAHTRPEVLDLLGSWGYTCSPFEDVESEVMNFSCLPTPAR